MGLVRFLKYLFNSAIGINSLAVIWASQHALLSPIPLDFTTQPYSTAPAESQVKTLPLAAPGMENPSLPLSSRTMLLFTPPTLSMQGKANSWTCQHTMDRIDNLPTPFFFFFCQQSANFFLFLLKIIFLNNCIFNVNIAFPLGSG